KEAKKRCTLVTAKFDARFDQARGKLNCAGKLSEEAALQAIRTYVACEDKKRAERFEQTDWLEDPDATRDALNETLYLEHAYKHSTHELTAQNISVAGREVFGDSVTQSVISGSWDPLRKAILELERRELARFRRDERRSFFDPLFATETIAPSPGTQQPS